MRLSRVREKLRAGKPVLCTKMNSADPVVADIIGILGFDCLWLCNEHTPLDGDRLCHLIRTAALNKMDTMVRTSKGSYSDLVRPLEAGASGLMIPHCMSADEARHIVRNTRFHPVGCRPMDGGNIDGQYCMLPMIDYMRLANENTFVVVQIEDPEALEQMDEIAAVEGIDALFVGPGDLSQAMGIPGQTNHPEVEDAIRSVARACQKQGRAWGLPVTAQNSAKYVEMGARFLSSGADIFGLQVYYRELRRDFERLGFAFSSEQET